MGMRESKWCMSGVARVVLAAAIVLMGTVPALAQARDHRKGKEKTLYIWAGDQAHKASDFLAVIDFDEESADYGKVIKTVPLPPPGNIGNEAHHCHLNSTGKLLGCGGLLSCSQGAKRDLLLRRQRGEKSAVPVLRQSRGIGHYGRLSAHRRRRIPDHADGLGQRRSPGRIAEFDGQSALCRQPFRANLDVPGMARRRRRWTDSTRMESPPDRI